MSCLWVNHLKPKVNWSPHINPYHSEGGGPQDLLNMTVGELGGCQGTLSRGHGGLGHLQRRFGLVDDATLIFTVDLQIE